MTTETGCRVLDNVLAAMGGGFQEKLGITISLDRGKENIDVSWRSDATNYTGPVNRWLWVLRDSVAGRIKGCGYCSTAQEAIKMAFEAASFAAKNTQMAAE